MATLAEIKAKYPAYRNVDDQRLADALYNKFYAGKDRREFDARIGLKPFAGPLEAAGAAIVNAPARMEIGLQGLVVAGREALADTLTSLVEDADTVAASPTRPKQFDTLASYSGADTPAQVEEKAEDFWQRFRDPATRDAVVQEIGMAQAKSAAGAQLRVNELQQNMAKADVRPGSIEDYFGQAIGAVAESSPGLVASVAARNPVPALIAIGGQSFGSSYLSGREKGLEADDARTYAALNAGAEAIPELLPLGVFLKEGGGLLMKVGGGSITEGASEAMTAGIQALIDRGYLDPDMTWGEAWPKIKDAAIVGAAAGGLMGGVAAGTATVRDAAGAGINAARQVSEEVLGKGVQLGKEVAGALENTVRDSVRAGELAQQLAGKDLEERIRIFADEQQAMRESPTAEAPTAEEGGEPTTADLLRHFEGFASKPYWDVNANRAGYGSDTITNEDGSFRRVREDDVVDEEAAERDLQRRLDTEFIPSARGEVGVEEWDALPPRVQAALGSVTYNYGNLPDSVAEAARSGDIEAIASAVEGLAGHNDGINENRRLQEAAIIRGEDVDLTPGKALTGSPRKRLTAYLDLADRTLQKLAGATTEEGIARSSKTVLADERGNLMPDTARALSGRQQRANDQAVDERQNLAFILSQIRTLANETGTDTATIEPITERLVEAIDATPLPTIAPAEAEARIAEQAPLEPPTAEQASRGASREVEAITPAGKRVKVRPEVVDIGTLQKATGAMQPRDRSRAASDAQIEDIAINLDPERLMNFSTTDRGAPIVGPDGVVESGNGRVAALRRAAEAYPEKFKAYRAALEKAGYDLTGIDVPVLVGRRTSEMSQAEREAFAADSNTSATAQLSASEQATNDAKLVDKSVVDAIEPGKRMGPAFTKAFLDKLPQSERARLVDKDGQLNADGVRRINNALLAAAYGDPATTARAAEDVDDNAKSITGALIDVAPQWVGMRQSIKDAKADPAYDMTAPLMDAINLLARAREKAAQQGRPVKALINEAVGQIDMLSGDVDPVTIEFVKAFYSEGYGRAKSRDDIAAFLRAITTEVETAIQPSMFGDSPKPAEVIGGAARKSEREVDRTGDIFASANPRASTAKSRKADRKSIVRAAGARATQPVESSTANLTFNPGPGYQPMLGTAALPARQTSVQVASGDMKLPERVTMRDEPRKKLIEIIGPRLYQEKIKGKARLGFYRHQNSEIRIKHFDDIEVMAHEAAHFLDFHRKLGGVFTRLRQRFAAEIDPLSYTTEPALINLEGFAEYVRLWATQYATAKRVAPNFTAAFEAELRKAGLWRKMTAFQEAAHRWYYQGDLARFRGKSGESGFFADKFHEFMRQRPMQQFIQGMLDPVFAAKVIERETTGTIASAEASPWKLYRMTRGAESMLEAAIEDGALVLLPDGSYGTTGKGLKQILWPATRFGAKRLDQAMEYFKARRASELLDQGRENLFTPEEVAAGLALGDQFPEFKTMFAEYQAFNRQMLDFFVDMDLITAEQRDAFKARNKAYVPFFRVVHQVEGEANQRGTASKIGTTLRGGERNTQEIATNIIDGLHANIQAALTARAKANLFATIQKSQEGSVFAVELGADSKRLKVAEDQMAQRIADVLVRLGKDVVLPSGQVVGPGIDPNPVDMSDIDSLLATYPELMAFWLHNQTPTTVETAIESTIINGQMRHFEIQSKLLADMLVAPRAAPALVRLARIPKRILTQAITSLPQFQIPNAIRDTLSMGASSQSGARVGYETLRGFASHLKNDARFKAFRANGGLFSGRSSSLQDANRKWAQLALPSRNGWDTVGKALAGWNTVTASVEQGSRIGEFSRGVDKGVNPLEAAFRGRMISGDFAQMGRNEVWGWLLQVTPFANAGLRGIESMIENLFTVDGRARVNAKSLGKFGLMAVTRAGALLTTATALLWLLNNDDERYKRLTVDEKARFWHVWLPSGEHIQIPKPYGVGFIFADIPEIALDYIKDRDGEAAAKQMAFALAQHFWFMDYPGVLQPGIEALANRKFTGAPIVPQQLQALTGEDTIYQRTDSTPQFYRDLGKALKTSPLMAEHYTKGFLGYAEAYMVDGYEWLTWNREKWGEKPFARDVLSYFTHQFDGKESPFRTKWTEGYYELRARAQSKAQAYRTLFKEGSRDTAELTEFSKSEVNLLLRSLASKFAKVDKTFQGSDALLQAIKYDPKLSREEKERRINAFYDKRNAVLGDTYQQISGLVRKLEEGIKQP